MITSKYAIRNATNMLWYTENHDEPMENRWSPDFSDAHFYLTKEDAESEIEIDNHGLDYFNIFEVIIKS
jgi:hypothetical protein